jgi:uncharacterized repeat protein (TIGR01451 family)
MTFGASGITAALSANTGAPNNGQCSGQNEASNAFLTGNSGGQINGADQFYTPSAPSDAVGVCGGHPGSAAGGPLTRTVTLSKPLLAPVFSINNLDASELTFNPGPSGGAIQLQALSASPPLQVVGGNTLRNGNLTGSAGCSPTPVVPTNNSGCGSFRMTENGGAVSSFTLLNTPLATGPDGWLWSLWFPKATLSKQFGASQIYQGHLTSLTFTVDNPSSPGQPTLTPLDFADALPAGLTLAAGTPSSSNCGSPTFADGSGGAVGAGDTGFKAGNITVAAGVPCTITVNVTSNTPGCYTNDNSNLSTVIGNLVPTASAQLCVLPETDVEIIKDTTAPVVAGTEATYTLKAINHGPGTATNVKVSDPLPSAMTYVSSSGCNEANGTVTCTIASLPSGGSQTFTVKVKVASSVKGCTTATENTATVTSDTHDPDPSNNTSTRCNVGSESDLKLTKDASSAQVASGGQVMYTLVVENLGPSDDDHVKVTDPLAAGLSLVSAKPSQGSCSTTGGKVSCDLGTLEAGGSAQILVTANVTAAGSTDCAASSITNTGSVTGDSFDRNLANNKDSATICVTPGPPPHFDLVVDKTANHTTITGGKTVTYTIVVTNKGPDAAPGVALHDTLNDPVTVVSVKTTQGSCGKSIPMSCSLGTIPAGGKVTITVVARPKTAGCNQINAASATGAGVDADPANNLDTAKICVKVDLRLTKVADRTTVDAGGRIHYTIKVTNPSKVTVKDARVCDTLPSGLAYVSSKPKATLSKGRQCWTIVVLGPQKSKTFKLTVRALAGASGTKVNRVTATGDGVRAKRASRTVHVLGKAVGPAPVTG